MSEQDYSCLVETPSGNRRRYDQEATSLDEALELIGQYLLECWPRGGWKIIEIHCPKDLPVNADTSS